MTFDRACRTPKEVSAPQRCSNWARSGHVHRNERRPLRAVSVHSVNVLALALPHIFIAALNPFARRHRLYTSGCLHCLNVFWLARLYALAGLHALNVFIGLNALDSLARFDPLSCFAGL